MIEEIPTESKEEALRFIEKERIAGVYVIQKNKNKKSLALIIYLKSFSNGQKEIRLLSLGINIYSYQNIYWSDLPTNDEASSFNGIKYYAEEWGITPVELIKTIKKQKPPNW